MTKNSEEYKQFKDYDYSEKGANRCQIVEVAEQK